MIFTWVDMWVGILKFRRFRKIKVPKNKVSPYGSLIQAIFLSKKYIANQTNEQKNKQAKKWPL